ncbi:MAG TPA: WG repeat-containing protein, partial [Saprospiraceae bacterium]|nr:WG repeat-containing protein [Saprospiraceae bacterium]
MQKPLFRIREKGYYGYIDAKGEVVIEPQYLDAGDFRNGFACVRLNDRLVLLDSLGRLYLRRAYRFIGAFEENLARVQVVQAWGSLDRRGREVIAPRFED